MTGEHDAEARFCEQLRALGHPARLAILRALEERSRCCCGDFCRDLPLAQSTVSQHLKVLTESGLVRLERAGLRSNYTLDLQALFQLRAALDRVLAARAAPAEEEVRAEIGQCRC
ncbi:ArsR/SmtB family transcription factor [Propylenella binzhouense]|uniref:Transcriptional regulator n=1 Tax=Propylenella binzhouense TaxID=2555902 RepID=A0A964T2Z1_9HYPH|nr:metalloregulator ArsR/SmtB family transcription factor [Propylenella binzhouense]MYZ47473.1 transcriptional regulator [Propylenella binzhouense]